VKFYLRFAAFLTALSFSFTSILWGEPILSLPQKETSRSSLISVKRVRVPSELGVVQKRYEASAKSPAIILIQDAHSIPDAQRNIYRLIQHFQTEYGVPLVALEGASERLDPQMFRSFPEKELLREVLEGYFERGELAGGTAAAVFSPEEAKGTLFHGIEENSSYETGLGLYLEAMKQEPQLLQEIGERKALLRERQEKTYSRPLLEIDKSLTTFYENQNSLPGVLKQLAQTKRPPEGSELALLLEEVEREPQKAGSFDKEVKKIAAKLKTFLKSKETSPNFKERWLRLNAQEQEFKTSRISPEAYALVLEELAQEEGAPLKVSERFSHLMKNQKRLRDIEGTKLIGEFERYSEEVKAALVTTDEERNLDREARTLRLLERLARLQLSYEEWAAVKVLPFTELGLSLEEHRAFYENAEERDRVFFTNLLKLLGQNRTRRTQDAGRRSAVLVAGGFHTQSLTRRFEEKGISYVLLAPKINSVPEETNYRAHMKGEVSWKAYFEIEGGRINLYKAFIRGTRDKLLEKNGMERGALLKAWRDQTIRDLSDQGRITEVSRYTRFLDELVPHASRSPLMARVEEFIRGLRKLETQGQLTQQNIVQLLSGVTIPAAYDSPGQLDPTASLIAPGRTHPALRSLTSSAPARSEMRTGEAQQKALRERMRQIAASRGQIRALEERNLTRVVEEIEKIRNVRQLARRFPRNVPRPVRGAFAKVLKGDFRRAILDRVQEKIKAGQISILTAPDPMYRYYFLPETRLEALAWVGEDGHYYFLNKFYEYLSTLREKDAEEAAKLFAATLIRLAITDLLKRELPQGTPLTPPVEKAIQKFVFLFEKQIAQTSETDPQETGLTDLVTLFTYRQRFEQEAKVQQKVRFVKSSESQAEIVLKHLMGVSEDSQETSRVKGLKQIVEDFYRNRIFFQQRGLTPQIQKLQQQFADQFARLREIVVDTRGFNGLSDLTMIRILSITDRKILEEKIKRYSERYAALLERIARHVKKHAGDPTQIERVAQLNQRARDILSRLILLELNESWIETPMRSQDLRPNTPSFNALFQRFRMLNDHLSSLRRELLWLRVRDAGQEQVTKYLYQDDQAAQKLVGDYVSTEQFFRSDLGETVVYPAFFVGSTGEKRDTAGGIRDVIERRRGAAIEHERIQHKRQEVYLRETLQKLLAPYWNEATSPLRDVKAFKQFVIERVRQEGATVPQGVHQLTADELIGILTDPNKVIYQDQLTGILLDDIEDYLLRARLKRGAERGRIEEHFRQNSAPDLSGIAPQLERARYRNLFNFFRKFSHELLSYADANVIAYEMLGYLDDTLDRLRVFERAVRGGKDRQLEDVLRMRQEAERDLREDLAVVFRWAGQGIKESRTVPLHDLKVARLALRFGDRKTLERAVRQARTHIESYIQENLRIAKYESLNAMKIRDQIRRPVIILLGTGQVWKTKNDIQDLQTRYLPARFNDPGYQRLRRRLRETSQKLDSIDGRRVFSADEDRETQAVRRRYVQVILELEMVLYDVIYKYVSDAVFDRAEAGIRKEIETRVLGRLLDQVPIFNRPFIEDLKRRVLQAGRSEVRTEEERPQGENSLLERIIERLIRAGLGAPAAVDAARDILGLIPHEGAIEKRKRPVRDSDQPKTPIRLELAEEGGFLPKDYRDWLAGRSASRPKEPFVLTREMAAQTAYVLKATQGDSTTNHPVKLTRYTFGHPQVTLVLFRNKEQVGLVVYTPGDEEPFTTVVLKERGVFNKQNDIFELRPSEEDLEEGEEEEQRQEGERGKSSDRSVRIDPLQKAKGEVFERLAFLVYFALKGEKVRYGHRVRTDPLLAMALVPDFILDQGIIDAKWGRELKNIGDAVIKYRLPRELNPDLFGPAQPDSKKKPIQIVVLDDTEASKFYVEGLKLGEDYEFVPIDRLLAEWRGKSDQGVKGITLSLIEEEIAWLKEVNGANGSLGEAEKGTLIRRLNSKRDQWNGVIEGLDGVRKGGGIAVNREKEVIRLAGLAGSHPAQLIEQVKATSERINRYENETLLYTDRQLVRLRDNLLAIREWIQAHLKQHEKKDELFKEIDLLLEKVIRILKHNQINVPVRFRISSTVDNALPKPAQPREGREASPRVAGPTQPIEPPARTANPPASRPSSAPAPGPAPAPVAATVPTEGAPSAATGTGKPPASEPALNLFTHLVRDLGPEDKDLQELEKELDAFYPETFPGFDVLDRLIFDREGSRVRKLFDEANQSTASPLWDVNAAEERAKVFLSQLRPEDDVNEAVHQFLSRAPNSVLEGEVLTLVYFTRRNELNLDSRIQRELDQIRHLDGRLNRRIDSRIYGRYARRVKLYLVSLINRAVTNQTKDPRVREVVEHSLSRANVSISTLTSYGHREWFVVDNLGFFWEAFLAYLVADNREVPQTILRFLKLRQLNGGSVGKSTAAQLERVIKSMEALLQSDRTDSLIDRTLTFVAEARQKLVRIQQQFAEEVSRGVAEVGEDVVDFYYQIVEPAKADLGDLNELNQQMGLESVETFFVIFGVDLMLKAHQQIIKRTNNPAYKQAINTMLFGHLESSDRPEDVMILYPYLAEENNPGSIPSSQAVFATLNRMIGEFVNRDAGKMNRLVKMIGGLEVWGHGQAAFGLRFLLALGYLDNIVRSPGSSAQANYQAFLDYIQTALWSEDPELVINIDRIFADFFQAIQEPSYQHHAVTEDILKRLGRSLFKGYLEHQEKRYRVYSLELIQRADSRMSHGILEHALQVVNEATLSVTAVQQVLEGLVSFARVLRNGEARTQFQVAVLDEFKKHVAQETFSRLYGLLVLSKTYAEFEGYVAIWNLLVDGTTSYDSLTDRFRLLVNEALGMKYFEYFVEHPEGRNVVPPTLEYTDSLLQSMADHLAARYLELGHTPATVKTLLEAVWAYGEGISDDGLNLSKIPYERIVLGGLKSEVGQVASRRIRAGMVLRKPYSAIQEDLMIFRELYPDANERREKASALLRDVGDSLEQKVFRPRLVDSEVPNEELMVKIDATIKELKEETEKKRSEVRTKVEELLGLVEENPAYLPYLAWSLRSLVSDLPEPEAVRSSLPKPWSLNMDGFEGRLTHFLTENIPGEHLHKETWIRLIQAMFTDELIQSRTDEEIARHLFNILFWVYEEDPFQLRQVSERFKDGFANSDIEVIAPGHPKFKNLASAIKQSGGILGRGDLTEDLRSLAETQFIFRVWSQNKAEQDEWERLSIGLEPLVDEESIRQGISKLPVRTIEFKKKSRDIPDDKEKLYVYLQDFPIIFLPAEGATLGEHLKHSNGHSSERQMRQIQYDFKKGQLIALVPLGWPNKQAMDRFITDLPLVPEKEIVERQKRIGVRKREQAEKAASLVRVRKTAEVAEQLQGEVERVQKKLLGELDQRKRATPSNLSLDPEQTKKLEQKILGIRAFRLAEEVSGEVALDEAKRALETFAKQVSQEIQSLQEKGSELMLHLARMNDILAREDWKALDTVYASFPNIHSTVEAKEDFPYLIEVSKRVRQLLSQGKIKDLEGEYRLRFWEAQALAVLAAYELIYKETDVVAPYLAKAFFDDPDSFEVLFWDAVISFVSSYSVEDAASPNLRKGQENLVYSMRLLATADFSRTKRVAEKFAQTAPLDIYKKMAKAFSEEALRHPTSAKVSSAIASRFNNINVSEAFLEQIVPAPTALKIDLLLKERASLPNISGMGKILQLLLILELVRASGGKSPFVGELSNFSDEAALEIIGSRDLNPNYPLWEPIIPAYIEFKQSIEKRADQILEETSKKVSATPFSPQEDVFEPVSEVLERRVLQDFLSVKIPIPKKNIQMLKDDLSTLGRWLDKRRKFGAVSTDFHKMDQLLGEVLQRDTISRGRNIYLARELNFLTKKITQLLAPTKISDDDKVMKIIQKLGDLSSVYLPNMDLNAFRVKDYVIIAVLEGTEENAPLYVVSHQREIFGEAPNPASKRIFFLDSLNKLPPDKTKVLVIRPNLWDMGPRVEDFPKGAIRRFRTGGKVGRTAHPTYTFQMKAEEKEDERQDGAFLQLAGRRFRINVWGAGSLLSFDESNTGIVDEGSGQVIQDPVFKDVLVRAYFQALAYKLKGFDPVEVQVEYHPDKVKVEIMNIATDWINLSDGSVSLSKQGSGAFVQNRESQVQMMALMKGVLDPQWKEEAIRVYQGKDNREIAEFLKKIGRSEMRNRREDLERKVVEANLSAGELWGLIQYYRAIPASEDPARGAKLTLVSEPEVLKRVAFATAEEYRSLFSALKDFHWTHGLKGRDELYGYDQDLWKFLKGPPYEEIEKIRDQYEKQYGTGKPQEFDDSLPEKKRSRDELLREAKSLSDTHQGGALVKLLREELEVRPSVFARKLGVSPHRLRLIESGRRIPSLRWVRSVLIPAFSRSSQLGAFLRLQVELQEYEKIFKRKLPGQEFLTDPEFNRSYPVDGRLTAQEVQDDLERAFGKLSREELLTEIKKLQAPGEAGRLLELLRRQTALERRALGKEESIFDIERGVGILSPHELYRIVARLRERYGRDGRLNQEEIKEMLETAFGVKMKKPGLPRETLLINLEEIRKGTPAEILIARAVLLREDLGLSREALAQRAGLGLKLIQAIEERKIFRIHSLVKILRTLREAYDTQEPRRLEPEDFDTIFHGISMSDSVALVRSELHPAGWPGTPQSRRLDGWNGARSEARAELRRSATENSNFMRRLVEVIVGPAKAYAVEEVAQAAKFVRSEVRQVGLEEFADRLRTVALNRVSESQERFVGKEEVMDQIRYWTSLLEKEEIKEGLTIALEVLPDDSRFTLENFVEALLDPRVEGGLETVIFSGRTDVLNPFVDRIKAQGLRQTTIKNLNLFREGGLVSQKVLPVVRKDTHSSFVNRLLVNVGVNKGGVSDPILEVAESVLQVVTALLLAKRVQSAEELRNPKKAEALRAELLKDLFVAYEDQRNIVLFGGDGSVIIERVALRAYLEHLAELAVEQAA